MRIADEIEKLSNRAFKKDVGQEGAETIQSQLSARQKDLSQLTAYVNDMKAHIEPRAEETEQAEIQRVEQSQSQREMLQGTAQRIQSLTAQIQQEAQQNASKFDWVIERIERLGNPGLRKNSVRNFAQNVFKRLDRLEANEGREDWETRPDDAPAQAKNPGALSDFEELAERREENARKFARSTEASAKKAVGIKL